MFGSLLLNKIYTTQNKGQSYMIFCHSDKTWIFPSKCIKPALELYQPSTFKGNVLKKMVELSASNKAVQAKLGIKSKEMELNKNIKELVDKIAYNIQSPHKEIYVAGYMGDTSSEQNEKVTLQIYDENQILVYLKITDKEKVGMNFDREIDALNSLKEKGIENIPEVLAEEHIDGLQIFGQSTFRGLNCKIKLKLGLEQMEFVKKINSTNLAELDYEETDIFKSVEYVKSVIGCFTENQQKVLNQAIELVEEGLKEEKHSYGFYHGDFTPWNVYYDYGVMQVFDFEYCEEYMPIYMDIFHYFTQMSVLGMNNETGGTIHLYKKYRKIIEQYVTNPELVYLCYLLHIVGFYNKRTKSEADISVKYNQWIELMEYLVEKVK